MCSFFVFLPNCCYFKKGRVQKKGGSCTLLQTGNSVFVLIFQKPTVINRFR